MNAALRYADALVNGLGTDEDDQVRIDANHLRNLLYDAINDAIREHIAAQPPRIEDRIEALEQKVEQLERSAEQERRRISGDW